MRLSSLETSLGRQTSDLGSSKSKAHRRRDEDWKLSPRSEVRRPLHYLGYLGTDYAPGYSCLMTLSSMVVSRDFQEVSVLECILGGLHIGVEVESEPERARAKLAKSKIDALIIDCDLCGAPVS